MASPSLSDARVLLRLTDICLDYGEWRALHKVNLTIEAAQVHAIVGEHGAGKSSLGMVIAGIRKPQAGLMTFDGQPYRALTLKAARQLGIAIVHQQILSLNERFTVAENLFLSSAPFHRLIWKQKTVQAVADFFTRYHVTLDPLIPVEQLKIPDRIFVEILKHLYARPRLLILDEALEKLSASALQNVLQMLTEFEQTGMSLLFITHRIDDIYEFADKVSVIKHGEILITDDVRQLDKLNLIKIAYTQISQEPTRDNLNQEFYHLLKYNEAILRNLPVNLLVTDPAHRIKLVNDYCRQYFHLETEAYENLPVTQLVQSPNAEVARLLAPSDAPRESLTFYQVPLTINGVRITSNIKTFPIYDGSLLIGNIIIIEDITEYDHIQKQLFLSEKLASVGLLAAGVAHEINTPLEILFTHLDYMKYRFHTEEFHAAIDTLHEQIAYIASIVGNLHSFSDHKSSIPKEIELNSVIQRMLTLVRHHARRQQIRIHFIPCAAEVFIRANDNEIKQVILNLLKNSFEAMPAGGDIFIATALVPIHAGHLVELTFRDTGCGICDENPNNIFLPFYSTKTKNSSNIGMGLSVSYGIITKYQGTIIVENTTDSGCQFLIRLPAAS